MPLTAPQKFFRLSGLPFNLAVTPLPDRNASLTLSAASYRRRSYRLVPAR
jgi:hypothetical protein